ncbi:hypothetical protein CC1G_04486 [Coprinopsis cinerea okayama7|uniref:Zinc-finger domain-containing protein n=1 Tax=Coprinopsis cinerea (strain Okayama-7 / 130 / ATCC MYA-4618 / FGSC 9003) TaxID=240176 RepID=A8N5A8_COPC7|nr:hypothetical protein CC1G_04486 [Coprinopsis cinerea okayama7\|eukprot:XP_001830053.2 hypothetical protein CC1G_04486 [Coprinopsis cinerea okayama7\
MSPTATPTSAISRHSTASSTVYVQVPTSSSLDLERYRPLVTAGASATRTNNKVTSTHVSLSSSKLKENTPLQPLQRLSSKKSQTMLSSASSAPQSASMKRKFTDRDRDPSADSDSSASKRIRSLSSASASAPTASAPLKPSQLNSSARTVDETIEVDPSKACPEFPNGWTYCHQCCKKRDLGDTIHCTTLEQREVGKTKVVKSKRCVNKFCRPCLKNRYNLDLDALKTNKKREPGHLDNAGYYFNAMAVRKSLPNESASSKKAKAKPTKPDATAPVDKKKARPKAQRKIKTLAPVKWTRVATALDQSELEERLYIREFLLRFNHLSEAAIPKAHLDELDQLNGNGKSIHGVEELDEIAWVGDNCVKAIFIGLLGLFARADDVTTVRASHAAVRALRQAGLHLSKVWGILVEWQNAVNAALTSTSNAPSGPPSTAHESASTSSSLTNLSSNSRSPSVNGVEVEGDMELFGPSAISLSEPQTLPLTILAAVDQGRRATRGMTSATTMADGSSISILSASQFIPVILSMIDQLLQQDISAIREDLDEGLKTSKELVRKVRECVRGEGERWEVIRKERESMKDKEKAKDKHRFQFARKLHRDILSALDHSGTIAQSEFALRFVPSGTDPDGRVYYIPSPGFAEREAAVEYIDTMHTIREQGGKVNSKLRLKKRVRPAKAEERDEFIDFSWMVLVWGQMPDEKEAFCPNVPRQGGDDEDAMSVDGDEDDPEKERWYAFAHPEDIKHLAEWVAADNGLDEEEGSSDKAASADNDQDAPIKRLVSELKQFAELLEWRSLDDRYRLPNEAFVPTTTNGTASANGVKSSSAKTKAIPPERFYAQ